MKEIDFSTRKGWQCPVCGHVYAPWMAMCSYCPPLQNAVEPRGTAGTPIASPARIDALFSKEILGEI